MNKQVLRILEIQHEIMYKMSLIERVMINTSNFESKRQTHKSKKSGTERSFLCAAKNWND